MSFLRAMFSTVLLVLTTFPAHAACDFKSLVGSWTAISAHAIIENSSHIRHEADFEQFDFAISSQGDHFKIAACGGLAHGIKWRCNSGLIKVAGDEILAINDPSDAGIRIGSCNDSRIQFDLDNSPGRWREASGYGHFFWILDFHSGRMKFNFQNLFSDGTSVSIQSQLKR